MLSQPFDGDGLITALSLRDGRAHFRSRFVQTRAYIEEEREGRWLYRGAFASGNPSGGLFFNPFYFSAKNVSNTGLLPWRAGGELLSLHEAGLPHRVDGRTLRTLGGETDLGGVVEGGVLAAHPRTTHDRIINFSAEQGQGEGRLTFYEWERRRASDDAPAASAAAPTTAIPDPDPEPALLSKVSFGGVAGLGFYHDHAITSKYYCVVENPTSIDTRRLLLEYMIGRCSIAETIAFDEERPMVLHLLPRPGRPGGEAGAEGPGAAQRLRFDIGPGFVFHLINAFDVEAKGRYAMIPQNMLADISKACLSLISNSYHVSNAKTTLLHSKAYRHVRTLSDNRDATFHMNATMLIRPKTHRVEVINKAIAIWTKNWHITCCRCKLSL